MIYREMERIQERINGLRDQLKVLEERTTELESRIAATIRKVGPCSAHDFESSREEMEEVAGKLLEIIKDDMLP